MRESFVVEAEGQQTGFIELAVQAWRKADSIWNLLIHRPCRRRGIGVGLVRAAVAWGCERGLRALGTGNPDEQLVRP